MRKLITQSLFDSTPKPTGPYPVGVKAIDLIDCHRKTIDYPEGWLIPIQIYFPIENSKAGYTPIHQKSSRRIETRSIPVWDHVQYKVYSTTAELSDLLHGNWPLVILSHGFTASSTDYAAQAEEIASHGFVVTSILHQLDTDTAEGPLYRKEHSLWWYARVIENILYTFHWINDQSEREFYGRLNSSKVCLMGHSMGSNAILLLLSRTSNPDKSKKDRFMLPHLSQHQERPRECAVLMDFNVSLAFPPNSHTPILFQVSQERKEMYQNTGIYEEMKRCGHKVIFYEKARHISFLDHGYLDQE